MKHTRTALTLAALAGAAGCTDLTERPVTGVDATYFQSVAGANAATTGTYARLRNLYGQEAEILMTMVGTDSWEKGEQLTANGVWNDYTAGLGPALADQGGVNALQGQFISMYQSVNVANTAIASISNATGLDAATKNVRLAEARFLRALFYLDIVRIWGAGQLNLEPTEGVVTIATRTPASEIYAKAIVPDLEFAIANLPQRQSEIFRATRGAAQMLLAQALLTRAASGDFDRARDLATAVINSGTYRLNTNYRSLFCDTDNGNGACLYNPSQKTDPELIFSVAFVGDGTIDAAGNNLHLYWVMNYDGSQFASPTLARRTDYGRPYRRLRPTPHLLGLWNRATDSRYDATFQRLWRQPSGDTAIFFPGTTTVAKVGQGRKYGESEYTNLLFPVMKKWLDQTRTDPNAFPGHRDRQLFRFAEAYLLRAEANVRAGRAADAIADINVLRARAAIPGQNNNVSAAEQTMFNADPLAFVLEERERELAGEENRWFTLARQGANVFTSRIRAFNSTAGAVQPYHILRPIPQTQIDRTEGGRDAFPQNPGYTG